MRATLTIILCALLVGAGRLTVSGHDLSWAGSYEAFSHILVGALLVVTFCPRFDNGQRWTAGLSLAAITALETVMFLTRKGS